MSARSAPSARGRSGARLSSDLSAAAPQGEAHAHPVQVVTLAQRVLHVAQVGLGDVLRAVGEEDEGGWGRAGLDGVADPNPSGRRRAVYQSVHELGDLVRGHTQV